MIGLPPTKLRIFLCATFQNVPQVFSIILMRYYAYIIPLEILLNPYDFGSPLYEVRSDGLGVLGWPYLLIFSPDEFPTRGTKASTRMNVFTVFFLSNLTY
jgi:hypothetical protein